jgi:hypothetical protein
MLFIDPSPLRETPAVAAVFFCLSQLTAFNAENANDNACRLS